MKLRFFKLILILVLSLLFVSSIPAQTNRDEGIKLYEQGEYEKAIQILQAITQTDKNDRLAWVYLGASYVKLKRDNEAAKAFRKADGIRQKTPAPENVNNEFKITHKPRVAYTETARRNQTQGTIKLVVEFGADGKIGFVFPFRELPDGLTENAIEAARSIKFKSAMKDGRAVTSIKFIEYSFSVF